MAKILIVDDEEHIRFLYSEELTEAGYEVITADSGYKLLERIEQDRRVGMEVPTRDVVHHPVPIVIKPVGGYFVGITPDGLLERGMGEIDRPVEDHNAHRFRGLRRTRENHQQQEGE